MKGKKWVAMLTIATLLGASAVTAYAEDGGTCENGTHTPDLSYTFEADYHDCTGGCKVDSYSCEKCSLSVDINGYAVEYYEAIASHVPGIEVETEWSSCNGGYPDPVYECAECGYWVLEDGTEAFYVDGDGKHTPDFEGECLEPTYIECSGGYTACRYSCVDCGTKVFATGEEAYYTEGTGIHTPDLENVIEANYVPCDGGYKEDHYVCSNLECGTYVNAQGEELEYIEAEEPHTLEYVAKVEPTVDKEGCKEHWKCTVCGNLFADAEGLEWTFEFELVIDKLDKVEEPEVNEPEVNKPEVNKPDAEDKVEKEESNTVKTGDSANVMGYFTAMAAALAVMVSVVLKRKNA